MSIKPFTFRRRPAFTLFEMLITLSIFSVVAILSVTLLVNGLRSARKIQAQILLYSETQALMDQMARDIERNTVDYEAYYARAVQGDSGWHTPNYGDYAQSFYDPGTGGTEDGPYSGVNAYDSYYLAECPTDPAETYPDDCPDEVPVYAQLDIDTGAHPFTGIEDRVYGSGYNGDSATMNAFCESDDGSIDCTSPAYAVQDSLIIVNSKGDVRTVYSLEQFDSSTLEYTLSKVIMAGTDTDNDGIVNAWDCQSSYDCTDTYTDADGNSHDVPADSDLSDDEGSSEHDFIALSPGSLSIEDFYVIISPMEDPYRAFGEADEQVQPQITIVMTVSLSSAYGNGLIGDVPSIMVQRTISTGVYSKIPSYE